MSAESICGWLIYILVNLIAVDRHSTLLSARRISQFARCPPKFLDSAVLTTTASCARYLRRNVSFVLHRIYPSRSTGTWAKANRHKLPEGLHIKTLDSMHLVWSRFSLRGFTPPRRNSRFFKMPLLMYHQIPFQSICIWNCVYITSFRIMHCWFGMTFEIRVILTRLSIRCFSNVALSPNLFPMVFPCWKQWSESTTNAAMQKKKKNIQWTLPNSSGCAVREVIPISMHFSISALF